MRKGWWAVLAALISICAFSQEVKRAAPPNAYVDPAICATCHDAIARTYRQTGMGRSFYRLSTANVVEDFHSGKPFYHEASESYFAMIERGGKFYQRRWQVGFDGKETSIEEKQIDYVLGSGNHARTYLHLTNRNTLQQLPLAWYSEKGGYFAMNPGYDRADYQGSTRAIHYECMFCHNAYPRIPSGHEDAGAEAQYRLPIPEGIDCQRCHGPGQRHVQTAGRAGANAQEIRAAIVNPARLSPEREMEVCLQCHLETSSRQLPHSIQRFGRGPFSYVPGQPLGDFRIAFDRAAGQNNDVEVAHAGYRLRESQCFRNSDGKLRCTTCHDPHNIPRGEAALSHYNTVCGTCHEKGTLSAAAHAGATNCVGCHMPKRRTDDAVHIVMTDHKIVRRPPAGDLLAEKKEKNDSPSESYRGEVVLYYPEKLPQTAETSLYVALAQVTDRSNLETGLAQLSSRIAQYHPAQAGFYSGMAEGYRAAKDNAKAVHNLEEAARRAPASEIVLLELGSAFMESSQWSRAEAAFRRAKTLRPDDPAATGLLGWTLWQQNKAAEAKAALQAAIKLDPDLPDVRNYLGTLLMATGDAAAAEREFREAVRIDPAVAEYRAKLAALLASRNELAEAAYHAKAAVKYDPNLAGARLLLGQLLLATGDPQGGIRELEATIRLNPTSGRAHYELGIALARAGNRTAAVEHLKLAAQGQDADARAAALQVLQSLRQ